MQPRTNSDEHGYELAVGTTPTRTPASDVGANVGGKQVLQDISCHSSPVTCHVKFDPALARTLLGCAKRAYDLNPCEGRIGASCVNLNSSTTDASCVIEDFDRFVVIAFEGSHTAEDFIQDAKFLRCEIGPPSPRLWRAGHGLAVHHGFWEDINSLMPKILRTLHGIDPTPERLAGDGRSEIRGQGSEVRKDGALTSGDSGRPPTSDLRPLYRKPLMITGHSLGADLALLCAWMATNAIVPLPVDAVYAFAPARPGNSLFQAYYDAVLGDRTFCVANEDDPVPMLPPLWTGARRCGQIVFLRRDELRESPSINPGFWRMAWWNIKGAWRSWRGGQAAFLPNHRIEEYQKNLALTTDEHK